MKTDFQQDCLDKLEMLGSIDATGLKFAIAPGERHQEMVQEIVAQLSAFTQARILALPPLRHLVVASDTRKVNLPDFRNRDITKEHVLILHYGLRSDEPHMGSGRVIIINNDDGTVLYNGDDGME